MTRSLGQDFRYALRRMRQAPGFTAVAVATLALGIGANTAIFGVLDDALLRPLPFSGSDRLVRLFSTSNGTPLDGMSRLDARDIAAASKSFEGIAVHDHWRKNVAGIGGSSTAQETVVGLAPGAYFELLRIRPLLGRLFTAEQSVYGNHYVAAIGEGLWKTRFGSDPRVLGRVLRINGESYSIVAVLPDVVPAWMDQVNAPISIWTPYVSPDMWSEEGRTGRNEACLGRLKPGVSLEEARAELATLAGRLSRERPVDRGLGAELKPLADLRAGPVRPILLALGGAVAAVLLIACANLAGLLLARNAARSRELAIRAALGAGRARLLRQLLLETLLLSLAGGLAGLGVAWAAGEAFARIRSGETLPYTSPSNALAHFWPASLDLRILAFTLGASALTAILFGLAPALTGTRIPLVETLKEGGRSGDAGTGRQRLRRALVVAEIAFSLVLVFAAAVLTRAVTGLERRDPGFRADHLLLAHVFIPPSRYKDSEAISRFCEEFGRRVRTIPGVLDASVTTSFPPSMPWKQMFRVPGSPVSRPEDVPTTRFVVADERFPKTLGLTFLAGRDFSESDLSTGPPVAVVNEEFARRFLPGDDAVGRRILPGPPEGVPPVPLQDFGGLRGEITIVGVVRNFVNDGLARPAAPQLFALFRQVPGLNFGFKDIAVRTAANPESFAPAVARALESLDPEIPLGEVRSMETHVANQTADSRFTTRLLTLFAALGIVLAVIGAYGVVAYLVSQRTQELGVRLALGASSRDVLRLVLGYGLSIGIVGVALGFAGALAARKAILGVLSGVAPPEAPALAGAAGLLLLAVAAASAIPALRAVRIDPVRALRGR